MINNFYCILPFIDYELIGNGIECGDSQQITLEHTFSDPSECFKSVLNSESCGEYFELRKERHVCRCLVKGTPCKINDDRNTILYHIRKSTN